MLEASRAGAAVTKADGSFTYDPTGSAAAFAGSSLVVWLRMMPGRPPAGRRAAA